MMRSVHLWAAEHQLAWHVLIEFDEAFDVVHRRMVQMDDPDLEEDLWVRLPDVITSHWDKNIPSQETVAWAVGARAGQVDEAWRQDSEAANQWHYMGLGYAEKYFALGHYALGREKYGLAINVAHRLVDLAAGLPQHKLMSDAQKSELMFWLCHYANDLVEKSIDSSSGPPPLRFPYDAYQIDACLDAQAEYRRVMLQQALRLFAALATRKQLRPFSALELTICISHTVDRAAESSVHREAVLFILDLLEQLRVWLEEHWSDEAVPTYLEIHRQAEACAKQLGRTESKSLTLAASKARAVVSAFDRLAAIRDRGEAFDVTWPVEDE